jgi:hypothetical protein
MGEDKATEPARTVTALPSMFPLCVERTKCQTLKGNKKVRSFTNFLPWDIAYPRTIVGASLNQESPRSISQAQAMLILEKSFAFSLSATLEQLSAEQGKG